jgi:hypothetical protein
VSCVSVARGFIVSCDLLQSSSNVEVLQHSLEHGEGGLRLIEWYFVTCLVDTEEADCELVSIIDTTGSRC